MSFRPPPIPYEPDDSHIEALLNPPAPQTPPFLSRYNPPDIDLDALAAQHSKDQP